MSYHFLIFLSLFLPVETIIIVDHTVSIQPLKLSSHNQILKVRRAAVHWACSLLGPPSPSRWGLCLPQLYKWEHWPVQSHTSALCQFLGLKSHLSKDMQVWKERWTEDRNQRAGTCLTWYCFCQVARGLFMAHRGPWWDRTISRSSLGFFPLKKKKFIWLQWVLLATHELLVLALIPQSGMEPTPLRWECGVIATGLPGMSPWFL